MKTFDSYELIKREFNSNIIISKPNEIPERDDCSIGYIADIVLKPDIPERKRNIDTMSFGYYKKRSGLIPRIGIWNEAIESKYMFFIDESVDGAISSCEYFGIDFDSINEINIFEVLIPNKNNLVGRVKGHVGYIYTKLFYVNRLLSTTEVLKKTQNETHVFLCLETSSVEFYNIAKTNDIPISFTEKEIFKLIDLYPNENYRLNKEFFKKVNDNIIFVEGSESYFRAYINGDITFRLTHPQLCSFAQFGYYHYDIDFNELEWYEFQSLCYSDGFYKILREHRDALNLSNENMWIATRIGLKIKGIYYDWARYDSDDMFCAIMRHDNIFYKFLSGEIKLKPELDDSEIIRLLEIRNYYHKPISFKTIEDEVLENLAGSSSKFLELYLTNNIDTELTDKAKLMFLLQNYLDETIKLEDVVDESTFSCLLLESNRFRELLSNGDFIPNDKLLCSVDINTLIINYYTNYDLRKFIKSYSVKHSIFDLIKYKMGLISYNEVNENFKKYITTYTC
jgi:hypothetical protein